MAAGPGHLDIELRFVIPDHLHTVLVLLGWTPPREDNAPPDEPEPLELTEAGGAIFLIGGKRHAVVNYSFTGSAEHVEAVLTLVEYPSNS